MAGKIITPHLKIVEQIVIVMFFAVVIPISISGIVVNNVNQQSNRAQLRQSATLIANVISDEMDVFLNTNDMFFKQINTGLKYFSSYEEKQQYLNSIVKNSNIYKKIVIVSSEYKFQQIYKNCIANGEFAVQQKMDNGQYLVAIYDIETLKNRLFSPLEQDKRQIYITTYNGDLIAAFNYNKKVFEKSLNQLPENQEINQAIDFGKIKNQPFVYLKKEYPKVLIIVNTPKHMTELTIDNGRTNIILSLLVTALCVLFIAGLYTYYLYINIRQLFKGIIAISKGNYQRRIRLLSSVFTPYEIIFLASEFNRMINQINKSYSKLKKSNKELKELNEFRSNMIDTISHEFRTPLTSIQGYTSRLLRQDIEIDKETQIKSLKVIKKQSERLKRMIEDLLVIPDIEDARLNVIMDTISPVEIVDDAILLVKNDLKKNIVKNIPENISNIYADRDRFEQVIINLIENSVKYSPDEEDIIVNISETDDKITIEIKNKYPLISREKLKTLFDKFTRIDDSTTRTTRGTGLGLFIVKGLVEAMNGQIRLYSTEEYGFIVKLFFEKVSE